MKKIILVLISFASLVSCSSIPKTSASRILATDGDHRLEGFNETLLLGDGTGKLTIVKVGDKWNRHDITTGLSQAPAAVHVFQGKFFLLYNNGKFLTIDPELGSVEKTMSLPVKNPGDFVFASNDQIYVSLLQTGKVVKLDFKSGAEMGSIDLNSLRLSNGKIELHKMLFTNGNLFVQVARSKANLKREQGALAVIDTTDDKIKKVIELTAQNQLGIEPSFPMALDTRRKMLLLSLKGERPINTGMIIRIRLENLEIHDIKKANSGFQGILAFQEPFEKLFIIYHTSTPTTSSHLFVDLVSDDGALQSESNSSMVDSFDGLDALAINSAGTLVAMANTCITGFCPKGAGINFVEVPTSKPLPKLLAAEIGFEPTMVYFK